MRAYVMPTATAWLRDIRALRHFASARQISSTMDLNMGETIVAEASTGGVQQYWQGRMRCKIDNKAWEVRDTGTYLYSADGTFLDII